MRGKTRFLLLFLILLLISPTISHAHRMVVEIIETGVIQVRYDDGTISQIASVTAYDKERNILFEEIVNENGVIKYDPTITIYQLVADDGIGHRASWKEGESENILASIPLKIRAFLGISLLFFTFALFSYRRKIKN